MLSKSVVVPSIVVFLVCCISYVASKKYQAHREFQKSMAKAESFQKPVADILPPRVVPFRSPSDKALKNATFEQYRPGRIIMTASGLFDTGEEESDE